MIFQENIFHALFYLSNDQKYFLSIGKYVDCNCWFATSDVINFEVKFIFLISPFFYMTEKSGQIIFHYFKEHSANIRLRLERRVTVHDA